MDKKSATLATDITAELLRILKEVRPLADENPPPKLEGKALAAANLYVVISRQLEVGPPFYVPPPPQPPPPDRPRPEP